MDCGATGWADESPCLISNRKHVALDEAVVDFPSSSLAQKKPLAFWQSAVQNSGGMPNVVDIRPRDTISSLLRKLQKSLPSSGVLGAVSGGNRVNLRN
jgi:hypothetical protein